MWGLKMTAQMHVPLLEMQYEWLIYIYLTLRLQ